MQSKLLIFPFILINFFIFSYQKEILTEELTWKVHESKTLKLEISDNFHKRKIGLMNREFLEKNKGMIFIYDDLEPINIWMYNTFIPLDIIFLKKNKITKITPNVQPCLDLPCELYPSSEPVDMIIEINAGQAKILNLKVGDDLIFLKNRK